MTVPTVTGQTIYDEIIIRLGGLSNAFLPGDIISFLNDGKDETWAVLRSLDLDYAVEDTQATDSAADDYFIDLTTSTREYDLPLNCREIRAIEVTTTGYEEVKFEYRNFSDEEFQRVRRYSTSVGSGSEITPETYFYSVIGRRKFIMAQFVPVTWRVKIWYIKALDDLTLNDTLTEILHPFWRKIVDYAVERATLSAREETLSDRWLARWREDVKTLALSAGPRTSSNPVFISDFLG